MFADPCSIDFILFFLNFTRINDTRTHVICTCTLIYMGEYGLENREDEVQKICILRKTRNLKKIQSMTFYSAFID